MADVATSAAELRDVALQMVQDPQNGGVRVEDYLTTIAAAAGEAALAAAGFDVEGHDLTPGSGLFFEPVNEILTGEPMPPNGPPEGSVWALLLGAGVPLPTPESLYRHIAGTVGSADWGAVITTVPEDDQPWVLPLRQAYELRPHVLRIEGAAGSPTVQRHVLVTTALVQAMAQTTGAIDAAIGAQLACEVLFGTAKMTPMTDAAFAAAAG
jgi:hypothetical protein